MADETRSTDQSKSDSGVGPVGSDTAPGARPPAPGAANFALGRTSGDLAADQPAGHATPDLQSDGGDLAGSDDVTGGLGGTKVDSDAGGDIRRGRHRELHPEIDPDTRLGLRPVISSDELPDPPADVPSNTRSRAATGAVAGVIGSAILAALVYAVFWAGVAGVPTFVAVERMLLGSHGLLDHVLGLLGFLVVGGVWGGLFGLMVAQPTMLKGVAFGLLPTMVHWLVTAPSMGHQPFYGGRATGIGLPLLYHALIWGGVVGYLCGLWLRPPYSADTPPTTPPGAQDSGAA